MYGPEDEGPDWFTLIRYLFRPLLVAVAAILAAEGFLVIQTDLPLWALCQAASKTLNLCLDRDLFLGVGLWTAAGLLLKIS